MGQQKRKPFVQQEQWKREGDGVSRLARCLPVSRERHARKASRAAKEQGVSGASAFQWGLYRLAARVGAKLPFPRRVADSLDGRRQATEFWTARRKTHPAGDPVVWFHAASVGEARLVEPVVRRLRASLPQVEALLTYSSPSVTDWRERLAVDEAHFAPSEVRRDVELVFDAIKPDMLVF